METGPAEAQMAQQGVEWVERDRESRQWRMERISEREKEKGETQLKTWSVEGVYVSAAATEQKHNEKCRDLCS